MLRLHWSQFQIVANFEVMICVRLPTSNVGAAVVEVDELESTSVTNKARSQNLNLSASVVFTLQVCNNFFKFQVN